LSERKDIVSYRIVIILGRKCRLRWPLRVLPRW